MKKLFMVVIALSAAVAAVNPGRLLTPSQELMSASQAGNAAYRDGMHLGKLDVASGREQHISVGRWSSDANRAAFTAGYQAGFQQSAAAASDLQ